MTRKLLTTTHLTIDDSDELVCHLDDSEIWDAGFVEGERVALFKTEAGIEIVHAGNVGTSADK